jgi:hypothetical protein
MLGKPISGSINFPYGGTRGFRQSDLAGYFQDTFKVSSKLTLNLGLRWENFVGWPWTEVGNRMYQFVPAQNTVLQVGTNGIPRSGVYGRNDDFAPRVGLAYRIRSKTVYRMAFGTSYFPSLWNVATNLSVNPPEAVSTAFTNNQYDFPDAQPASAGFTRPTAGVIAGSSLYAIDPHGKTNTSYQWNAAIEQQLPGSVLLTIAYVGTKGVHLQLTPNINDPVPGTTAIATRRPYPTFQNITTEENIYNSDYNGLEVSAERRFSHGLDFLVSYTNSHALDDAGFQNYYNQEADYGTGSIDVTNHLVASWTYALPFKPSGLAGILARGWQANGILSVYSGLPFSVGSSTNTLNTGDSARANRICNGALPNPTIADWFNLSCFTAPGTQQWGNSARDILRGPPTRQLDFSVFKNFPLNASESRRVQFRAESFNLFNTPQFNNPATTVGAGGAGTISSAGAPITLQRTSREIQLSLRLFF